MALTCETLLALGRRDESPQAHRVCAWAPRMPVHPAIARIDRNARIGRKRRERSREGKETEFKMACFTEHLLRIRGVGLPAKGGSIGSL